MGIVALVVLVVTLAWSTIFGSLQPARTQQQLPMRYYWFQSGRALSRIHDYRQPARKAMVVDTSGMVHPTADNTGMTKRDRSLLLVPMFKMGEGPKEITPAPPALDIPKAAPLYEAQMEEAPLPPGFPKPVTPVVVREPSIGRKVQMAVLADPTLSRSAKLTFRTTSVKNKVILRGIVWDEKEKIYIGAKAAEIVGADNVDNRLTALNAHG